MANRTFKITGGLNPGRSVFDLSYEKKFNCDMGQLIPVLCDEAIPGDKWTIKNECLVRFQPLIAPIMHQIDVTVHYFFVPYRIIWDDWEEFITGGEDGQSDIELPRMFNISEVQKYSLGDYLGLPIGIVFPSGSQPVDFPRRAYNRIYNEFYRDQNIQTEVNEINSAILRRAWEKDYFTSALPWQQRGIAPSPPITGFATAEWPANAFVSQTVGAGNPGVNMTDIGVEDFPRLGVLGSDAVTNLTNFFGRNVVDMASVTSFDISDLRTAFQVQKFLERNARTGARYVEQLKAHYGVSPKDDRLQRPEYLGGTKQPVIISEVLQTSSTDTETPQGNLAGHGISVNRDFAASYHVKEHGLIMGLMSVMPKPAYQQGLPRQWLKETKYDFYFPEFAHLSEQAIYNREVYVTTTESENETIFGYQGRYDEHRVKHDLVCGDLRDSLSYWHLGRIFTGLPSLNSSFVQCVPSKRIFAVDSEPGLIINFGNRLKVVRPMPIINEPGLIDHF